jgi:hypothetical protein
MFDEAPGPQSRSGALLNYAALSARTTLRANTSPEGRGRREAAGEGCSS